MINEDSVLEANEKFYDAFNKQDADLMEKVWLDDPSVICIHPGWMVLRGLDAIMPSWQEIFQGSDPLDIKLSNVEVTASLDMVWVSCQENLFLIKSSGVQTSRVHATNIFKQVDNVWKMVLHHASALPAPVPLESRMNRGRLN